MTSTGTPAPQDGRVPWMPSVADIPRAPGVYRFLDPSGTILYVGKARNLARRLPNHFRASAPARTRRMIAAASTCDWTVCASEREALLLEREWIHRHQPPYNVRLRAGAGYPGLAVTRGPVPRLFVWRGRRPDNCDTFGPYPGASGAQLIDACTATFQIRSCDDRTYRAAAGKRRACLLGETGRCAAPCTGTDTALAAHTVAVADTVAFLRRPDQAVVDRHTAAMHAHADASRFEAAAELRDRIGTLNVIGQRQRIHVGDASVRVVAVVRGHGLVAVADVTTVDGTLHTVETYRSGDDPELDDDTLATQILTQLAPQPAVSGGRIDVCTVNGAVVGRRGRGVPDAVVAFAATQAQETHRRPGGRVVDDAAAGHGAGRRLGTLIGMPDGRAVSRVECVDISHLAGSHTVAAIVAAIDGVEAPAQRRHVNLGDRGGDDHQAIGELLRRRFSGRHLGLVDLPDILIIDGGPTQVETARRALADAGVRPVNDPAGPGDGPALVGIAKRIEELWPVGATVAVHLPADDPALRLVQQVRDAVHRHAVTTHRRHRDRAALTTRLDTIPGLGPQRRRRLLAHFGTLDAIAAAPLAELAAVDGIGDRLATIIHAAFHHPDTAPGGR